MPLIDSTKRSRRAHTLRARIAEKPRNSDLHQALGKVLMELGEYEAARVAYEESLAIKPGDPFSHLYYGNYFYTTGQLERALGEFKVARRLDPGLALALTCMADIYYKLNRMDKVGESIQKAAALDPDCPMVQEKLERWNKFIAGAAPNEPTT